MTRKIGTTLTRARTRRFIQICVTYESDDLIADVCGLSVSTIRRYRNQLIEQGFEI